MSDQDSANTANGRPKPDIVFEHGYEGRLMSDPVSPSIIQKSTFKGYSKEAFDKYADVRDEEVKRLREALETASKRSSYHWSAGGDYHSSDYENEGAINLANRLLAEQEKP